jgi:hypothetical protein
LKKFVTYEIEKISDQTLTWFLTNEYPYIRTQIIDRERFIIKKYLFKFFELNGFVQEKYFNTLKEAEQLIELWNKIKNDNSL